MRMNIYKVDRVVNYRYDWRGSAALNVNYYVLQGAAGKPYQPLRPTQAPINPPYQTACQLKKSNLLDQSNQLEFSEGVESLRGKQEEDRDGGVEETHSRIPGLLKDGRSDVHVAKAGGSMESDSVDIREDRRERMYCDTDNVVQGVEQGISDLSVTGVALRTEVEQELHSEDLTPVRLTESSEGLEPP